MEDFIPAWRRNFLSFIILLACSLNLRAGIMSRPRVVNVISTEFFDILFPKESTETAEILAESADGIFRESMTYMRSVSPFRMPVVISPDSDTFSVTYSPVPYNRIVIYESVPDADSSHYGNALLDSFRRETMRAVTASVKTPFWHFMTNFLGFDVLQPAVLLNLPFSLAEGAAHAADADRKNGILSDGHAIQILAQAKLDGEFPTWLQASGARDIYPGKQLALTAGAAFTAYIQQRWGIYRYAEFWNECGRVHAFSLTAGIFRKIYGVPLADVWKDFEDSVPLPDTSAYSGNGAPLFGSDSQGLYRNIMSTPYGLVWYDMMRHEVDIFTPSGTTEERRLLFLAAEVTRMTLSPDGRFLAVSHIQDSTRENFSRDTVWIYDLKERKFLSETFALRDAALIELDDGATGITGIRTDRNTSELQVWYAAEVNSVSGTENGRESRPENPLIFSRKFGRNSVPSSPIGTGRGKIALLLNENNRSLLMTCGTGDTDEQFWRLSAETGKTDGDNPVRTELKIRRLNTVKNIGSNGRIVSELYMFEFLPEGIPAFTRTACLLMDKDGSPDEIWLQKNDISGGMNSPALRGNTVWYSAHKFSHDELRQIPFTSLEFVRGKMEPVIPQYAQDEIHPAPEISVKTETTENGDTVTTKYLGAHEIGTYNPFRYMFHGTWIPMLPVKEISLENGTEFWPGLGTAYLTQSDPLMNNELTLSAGFGFAKLDFTKLVNPTEESLAEFQKGMTDFDKDISFAAFTKNTSTPVDISAGGLLKFNWSGQYDMKILLGTAWEIPLGMKIRRLSMDIQSLLTASTGYMDITQKDTHPDMAAWTAVGESYRNFKVSSKVIYTNIHQYGASPFEMRGISFGSTLLALWDINRIEADREGSESAESGTSWNPNNILETITQLNMAFFATAEIPRLTPLENTGGWILSVPAEIYAEIFNTNGTSLKAYTEFLLVGKEIQYGIPLLNLYFSRLGLKAGYDITLNYDTAAVSVPDIRDVSKFYGVFANSKLNDSLYLKLNMDFVPVVGRLSTLLMKSTFRFSFYPRTQGFKFSFDMKFTM